eukprot:TRINITY_DN3919_c0_g2_i1.p1 TRINITY_DN3919_c0_g2~~TRINITY_DN3919_c0_g2_i1.p1  ORF type:complete len:267 (-),score=35.45 TRINITY_DN3919_c0_g2_i1:426-1226(-)
MATCAVPNWCFPSNAVSSTACSKLPASLVHRSDIFHLCSRKRGVRTRLLKLLRAMDASFGGQVGYTLVFPRTNVLDPYKRLGVSRDATLEEIKEARNFLIEQYAGHERSVESIEAAYDKILMRSFKERKNSNFNFKSQLKQKVDESPPWLKQLLDCVEMPEKVIIYRRAFLFAVFAGWSIVKSAEGGPAFQVAASLVTCIYLLNNKIKNLRRALILGFGSLLFGCFFGCIFMPLIPSFLLPVTGTPELVIAFIAYIFLFVGCTFLK